MDDEGQTALGAARDRFLGSLAERARELHGLLDVITASPVDGAARERLRRRVHALYASAQVFQDKPLAQAIQQLVEKLDAARDQDRPLSPEDLEVARALVVRLGGQVEIAPPRERPSAPPDDQISSVFRLDALEPAEPTPVAGPPEAAASADAPVDLSETVAGSFEAPDVLGLMVVASAPLAETLRTALPHDRCELTTSSDPVTAAEVLDNVAPDVVLLDLTIARLGGRELVERLRGVRTDIVKSVALVSPGAAGAGAKVLEEVGADALIELPLEPEALLARLRTLARAGQGNRSHLAALHGGTVDDIARSVAEEVRRGIAESLRSGRGERIELGDKAEIMAATWSAIGRIRAHLAERTSGRVSFSNRPYAGGPAELALTDDLPAAPYVGVGDALRGRHVVVADDDPAVIWFFGGLLREAGAVVHEARDGKEALQLVRQRVPDVVISDILMPEIDGFALCRELRRDLTVSHVPVILLSWKEDFLQRMRELDSGASGYLRKEAGSHQILAVLGSVLEPRVELEALLSAGDEVQGRIDGIGVRRLVETVAERRPDARITVRDAWNMYELDVRDGSRLAVTRTASDGSFARREAALRQLLAVEVGRFSVTPASGAMRGEFDVPLDRALADAERRLCAIVDAVSDRSLLRVQRLDLDDEVLATLLTATPTVLAEVVACLKQADHPVSELLTLGSFPARELEQHLRELARRGGIRAVIGHDGEDLVAEAERERLEHPGLLLHSSERPAPEALPPTHLEAEEVEWLDGAAPRTPQEPPLAGHQAVDSTLPAGPRSRVTEPPPLPAHRRAPPSPGVTAPPPLPLGAITARMAAADPLTPEQNALDGAPTTPSDPAERVSVAPSIVIADATGALTADDAALDAVLAEPAPQAVADPQGEIEPADEIAQGFSVRSSLLEPVLDDGRRSAVPPPFAVENQSPWAVALTVIALFMAAFLAGRAYIFEREEPHEYAVPPSAGPSVEQGAPTPAVPPATAEEAAREAPQKPDQPAPSPSLGRALPFIDRSWGVEVGDGQGLLVLEHEAAGAGPQARIGDRTLGRAPLGVALDPGRHELVIERDGQTSFRFLTIRAGETRIVEVR